MTDWQSVLNQFCLYMNVPLPSAIGGLVLSQSKPHYDPTAPVAWGKLDSLNRLIRIYTPADGYWLAAHPDTTGKGCFINTAVNTAIFGGLTYCDFDGGDISVAPSVYSGPFWQIVGQAQFLIGAGTLASGTVLTLAGTGGEENHVLTTSEMPPHTHQIDIRTGLGSNGPGASAPKWEGVDTNGATGSTGGDPTTGTPPMTAKAHNNMPPYLVVQWAVRTSRIYYAETL